jgi:hypothetical protein
MSTLVTKRWSTPKLGDTPSGITASDTYDISEVADLKEALLALEAAYPETKINATHPLSPFLICSGRNGSMAGFGLFAVEVTYGTTPAGQFPDNSNPLNEPAKYRLEWQNTTEAAGRDAYGNAVINAVGEPFSSDSPAEVFTGMLYVERNEPFYDAPKAVAYANAVNDAPVTFHGIWNFDKGQACHRKYSCLTPITGKEKYVTVQYAIELRGGYKKDSDGYWDGFKCRQPNKGNKGWYSDSGTPRLGLLGQIIDNQFQQVSEPVLMNGKGKPINAATTLSSPNGLLVAKHGSGYAVPIEGLDLLPFTTIVEYTGQAYFIKFFPEGIKLKNLSALGL